MRVIFSRGWDARHNCVALFSGISHVAIVLADGTVVSMSHKKNCVKRCRLDDYLRSWPYVLICSPPKTDVQMDRAKFDEFVATNFSYCIRWSTTTCNFCTRHVHEALRLAGFDLTPVWHPSTLLCQLLASGWHKSYERGKRYDCHFAFAVANIGILVALLVLILMQTSRLDARPLSL